MIKSKIKITIAMLFILTSFNSFAWYKSSVGNYCLVHCTTEKGGFTVSGYAGACDKIPKDGGCPKGSSKPVVTVRPKENVKSKSSSN
jgi:hypothetical protein